MALVKWNKNCFKVDVVVNAVTFRFETYEKYNFEDPEYNVAAIGDSDLIYHKA